MKKLFICILFLFLLLLPGCSVSPKNNFRYSYGVFLNADSSDISKFKDYRQIVIDASYFTKEDIEEMHQTGHEIYTYLNIGSLEEFREYYDQYSYLCLGEYENWPGEKWVDVSKPVWQEHILTFAREYAAKGIDGFFVDNCDVYYLYPNPEIFDGLTNILRELFKMRAKVIINGGDLYVTEYLDRYQTASDIMSGVNQECLFTSIDFSSAGFSQSTEEDYQYFEEYIKRCDADHMDVYLLEYTDDKKLISRIQDYCEKNKYFFYISSSIELNADVTIQN